MKHKQNQTAVQAVMRLLAQELVDGLPDTTAKLKIARDIYALFQNMTGCYANEKSFYKVIVRLMPREVSFDMPLTRNNQTHVQYAMREAAKYLLAQRDKKVSKWSIAKAVYKLFANCQGRYVGLANFYQSLMRLGRKNSDT